MKIGLIGFGKTGKAVASVLLQNKSFTLKWVMKRNHILEDRCIAEYLGIDSDNSGKIYSGETTPIAELLDNQPVDMIIDFSSASGVYSYGKEASIRKVKIISAISHYSNKEKEFLKSLSKLTTVFWSTNITLGVNYLLFASKFLKRIAPWVDIEIIEEHFKGKDGVSGTALKIAETLDLEETDINSVRAGGIIGKHEVVFGFPFQTVRLIHESISREAFGSGVVFVAENLKDKEKGLYNFEDILSPYFVA